MRSCRDSFALCWRVIFFSQPVEGVVEQLGYVEAINHPLRLGQERRTGVVERQPHIDAIGEHLGPLRRRETLQALASSRLVAARHDRQHFGLLRLRQIGQDGHVQLVPLFQAEFIHADMLDDALRIDRFGVAELVPHDARHRFRGNAQTPGHFRFVAADQQTQHMLFEAIRIAGLLAFEGRNQILAMMAVRAAMERRRVRPEPRLAEHVEIAHDPRLAGELQMGFALMAAARARAALGPRPSDLEAVRFAAALVAGDFHALRQIDVDGDAGHGRPWHWTFPPRVSAAGPSKPSSLKKPGRREKPTFPGVRG